MWLETYCQNVYCKVIINNNNKEIQISIFKCNYRLVSISIVRLFFFNPFVFSDVLYWEEYEMFIVSMMKLL